MKYFKNKTNMGAKSLPTFCLLQALCDISIKKIYYFLPRWHIWGEEITCFRVLYLFVNSAVQ